MRQIIPGGLCSLRLNVMLLLLWCVLFTSACQHHLPLTKQGRTPTVCWQPDESLETVVREPVGNQISESGFLPIHGSMEALEWRLALIDSAKHSIDAQYFIWRIDDTGRLLLERLLQAADRGVQVRLLLDDVLKGGLDEKWIIINTHPNMEVRLFNPFRARQDNWFSRGPEWLFNMSRLNHRMHNKLFMVDQEVAIVGGRNISNEYFGLGSVLDFRDFDLLASGSVAQELDESFLVFWHSDWTYSPETLTQYRPKTDELETFRNQRREWLARSERLTASFDRTERDWSEKLAQARDQFIMAPARVVYDCPPGTSSPRPLQLVGALRELLEATHERLLIVSPYVILDATARERILVLRESGVDVTILTNSLEAADHNITFGAYAKRRRELLDKGVNIYELKAHGEQWQSYRTPHSTGEHLSMHAKLIVLDEEKIMVGSLNLDPRSKYINTEIGLLIRSKVLAATIMEQFEQDLAPENSWRVQLDAEGTPYWESASGRLDRQPARSFGQRVKVFLYGLLPLDHQL